MTIRTIYLPPFTLSYLRREIQENPIPTLNALHSDRKMIVEDKGGGPRRINNPLYGVPIDDIAEALGLNLALRSVNADPSIDRRRRPHGAACSITITDQERPK